MNANKIILCEPQCWGFEHAPFNAAFLHTALLAYPDSQVIFMAEQEHLNAIRQMLERHSVAAMHRVEWQALTIPPRNMSGLRRLQEEREGVDAVLRCAVDRQAQLLVWTSITNTGLLALKLWLYRRQCSFPMLVVIHGVLSTIMRLPRKPWKWLFNLRYVLRLPQPASLRYIALGDSIYNSLNRMQPALSIHFRSLDHPYFEEDPAGDQKENAHRNTLRFGYMGVGHKGKRFDTFARLAQEVHEQSGLAEFLLVGFLSGTYDHADYSWITGVSRKPLTLEEYRRRAASLTYTVCTANPEHYRLIASASFLDALSFGKPGIYLRNLYVEHYFGEMGDIGYLCDSYEDMRDTILSIIHEFPTKRYRKQCENIRHGRKLFTPQRLAPRLKAIIDEK